MSYKSTEAEETGVPAVRHATEDSSDSPLVVDEQQPLLHSEETDQHLLDPDDPIVSPLNLYNIKLIRLGVILLILVNLVLFFAFLISDFISIPGLNNRNESFLELDLIFVNLLTNLVTLWWFVIPAYYERVLGYVSFGLVVLDLVVVLVVGKTREQFGALGNFLLIWTAVNILVNSLTDYYVEKGKHFQEIKYTGRVEKRRSIWELFVISIKIVIKFALLLIIWNISLTLWISAFDTHEKPWGKLVSVADDQFHVHLACFGDVYPPKSNESALDGVPKDPNGKRQPIVLVEGGQLTSSEEFQEWIEELYHLNKIERYCVWDRPGYAWSESAPSPVSIGIITDYLVEALSKEGIEGPYSLVGFDIGGLYSRMFASKNVEKIHSLLLVDSWHEDLLQKRPFSGSNRKNEDWRTIFKNKLELMNTVTGFKLWVRGVISPLGLTTNFHWFFHPRKFSSKSRIFGRDMYYSPKYIRARLQEQITSSILSYGEIKRSEIHNVPVSVISSDFMIKNSLNWGKWQREISKLSDKTIEWVIAEKSDHFIWKSPKGKIQLQDLLLRLISEERL